MDRQINYAGAVPLETDLLSTNRNILIGLGLLAQDIFGTSTVVGGLPCTPNSPAALNVLVGPGRIYMQQPVDNTAYSSLPADTADTIVKQGINLGTTLLACAAPATPGYSINYLIEAIYQDQDTNSVTLPYYNASNPASPWSGPNNTGVPQATTRAGVVSLQAKAGIPAPTGTQATPSADAGYVGLYVVTVAYGQTTITGTNIVVAPNAPFISSLLLTEAVADLRYLLRTGGTLTGALTGTNAAFSNLTINGISVTNASVLTSGSIASSLVPMSAVLQYEGNLQIAFAQLTGVIFPAQVPQNAVTQFQSSFQIAWGQITGTKNADQLQGFTATANPTANTVALRDASGYLLAAYHIQSSANNENPTASQVIVTNGSDGQFRKIGLAALEAQMSLSSIGGLLNAGSQLAGVVPNARLPNAGLMTGVTIASDPGTVPSGSPGQVFEYY